MLELSVIMPCLNEEKTVGVCIKKCLEVFKQEKIKGEVIVVDNNSTDKSAEIARKAGAKAIFEPKRGYGNAYLRGLSEAKGKYIAIGDADNTYDFYEIPKFLDALREGYDFVSGTRLKGEIKPGAMPFLHRHIGNPLLTGLLNLFFKTSFSDVHCGFKAFTKEALKKLDLKCIGMEFASELTIKASKENLKTTEIPITYCPRDKATKSKLNSFKDGWRHLRFMLLFAPNWLFLVPGILIFLVGFIFSLLILIKGKIIIFGISFIIHPMIFGAFLSILGLQIISFGIYSKIYAESIGIEKNKKITNLLMRYFNLEKGTLVGVIIFLTGFLITFYLFIRRVIDGYLHAEKILILGMTLAVIGLQIIFSSWFLSMIGVEKR